MKISAEHTATAQEAVDMHTPIYDGRLGYTTEAEKQALIASIEQAEKDYEDGKWIDADQVFDRLMAQGEKLMKEQEKQKI